MKVASESEFNVTCHSSPKVLTSQNLRRCVAGVSVFRSIVSMRSLAAGTLAFALSVSAFAKDPDCTGQRQPPVTLAQTWLKEAKILDPLKVLPGKTTVVRLNSEKIGKDLYRQVHLVRFVQNNGESIQAIVVFDVSSSDCIGENADVYLVSPRIDPCDSVPKAVTCQIKGLAPLRK